VLSVGFREALVLVELAMSQKKGQEENPLPLSVIALLLRVPPCSRGSSRQAVE
jgi:hypothetical protein